MFYQRRNVHLSAIEIQSGNVYCPACSHPMMERSGTLRCVRCYTQLPIASVQNWPSNWRVAAEDKPKPSKKSVPPSDNSPASDDQDEGEGDKTPGEEEMEKSPLVNEGIPGSDDEFNKYIDEIRNNLSADNWTDPTVMGALAALKLHGPNIRLVGSIKKDVVRVAWTGTRPSKQTLARWVGRATGRVPIRVIFHPRQESIAMIETARSAEETLLQGLEAEVRTLSLTAPIEPTRVQQAIARLVQAEEQARGSKKPAVRALAMHIAAATDKLVGSSTTIQFTPANAPRWTRVWAVLAAGTDGTPLDRVVNRLGQSSWIPGDPAGFACALASFVHKTAGGNDYVVIGVKDDWATVMSKPGTRADAEKMMKVLDPMPGEKNVIMTVRDVKSKFRRNILGKEYLEG